MSVDPETVMKARPRCNCCRKTLTRIILPNTEWNESGDYMFHCKITGKVTPIRDITWVLKHGRQEPD